MNPLIVESALCFPHACLQCRTSTGPFLDTYVDVGNERLYLCMLCLRIDAEAVGFAEGERMEQLIHAKQTVEHAEVEVDERNARIFELENIVATRDASVDELQSRVIELEGECRRKDTLAMDAERSAREIYTAVEQPVEGIGVAG